MKRNYPASILLIALLLAPAGCGLLNRIKSIDTTAQDATTKATNALNDAIAALTAESASWQQVLTETRDKLTDEAQKTIRIEVQDLLSRSIATAGGEFRCNTDFIGGRVRQSLEHLRAKLLHQDLPPLEPGLCQVVPPAVEKALVPQRVNQIQYFGFDLKPSPMLAFFLEERGGARIPVTQFANVATNYTMTVIFGGNGVQLSDRSDRIVMEFNGKPVSSVAIIQPQTPVCTTRTVTVPLADDSIVPRKTGSGDNDFDGNGPRVSGRVRVDFTADGLFTTLAMSARETQSDHTAASGTIRKKVWQPDPGFRIDQVLLAEPESKASYVDNNWAVDSFPGGSGGPVNRFEFIGDKEGSDVGSAKMTVKYNPIRVVLAETKGCVSPGALAGPGMLTFMAPQTMQRLKLSRLIALPAPQN